MCGIAGIWNLNGEALPEGRLKRFTDAIYERGPDGSGYEHFDNQSLGLGHRRLSILDLSEAGHQPMYYANGRYAITYNGEVFNFGDIQAELEQKGHRFSSSSDTEVVLAAYAEWGVQCLNKFNGMWAFAIWDAEEKTLFMARDRFGIKPFYYLHIPGRMLAFASETRCFKALEGYNRELNVRNVELQMEGARIHASGHSIYKDIYSILPGHYILLKKDDTPNQKRWWHIQNHLWPTIPDKAEARVEEFYRLFRDACRLRLISDVSVGTALSGGLDSSAVYSVVYDLLNSGGLTRVAKDSQKAFVATFPGLPSDERHYAEEALGFTRGPAVFLDQRYDDLASQVVDDTLKFDGLLNFPITSLSGIYRGMKKAGITVSMDGHGVDEMLYGYRDMLYNLYYHFFSKGDQRMAEELRKIIVPTYPENERAQALKNLANMEGGSSAIIRRAKHLAKTILGRSAAVTRSYGAPAELPVLGEPYDFRGMDYADQVIYHETFTDTLPDIFRNFDLAGMMSSVEIRMPFMDWRLVTYMFSLPLEDKLGKGFNKLILRESMKGKMAEGIRTRTHKIGISSPVEHWFHRDLKPWVMDMMRSGKGSELADTKKVMNDLEAAYQSGKVSKDLVHRAWQHINLKIITG